MKYLHMRSVNNCFEWVVNVHHDRLDVKCGVVTNVTNIVHIQNLLADFLLSPTLGLLVKFDNS